MESALDALGAVAAGALGLLMGSFANVVVWRLPRRESIVAPPSACPACGARVRWHDNVPVLSWLALGGRCRDCASPIAWRYPFVEALCGLLFLLAWEMYPAQPGRAVLAAAFLWFLLVLTFIDLDTMRLPNPVVGAMAGIGAAAAVASQFGPVRLAPLVGPAAGPLAEPLAGAAAGALIGAGSSLLIALAYSAVRKVEGFGMGDVKLLGAMGLFLGPYVLIAFFAGSLLGSAWAVYSMSSRGMRAKDTLPFGPFLAGAGVLALTVGPPLADWYLGLAGAV